MSDEQINEDMTPFDIALTVCQTAFKDLFDPNFIKLAHAYRDLMREARENAELKARITVLERVREAALIHHKEAKRYGLYSGRLEEALKESEVAGE